MKMTDLQILIIASQLKENPESFGFLIDCKKTAECWKSFQAILDEYGNKIQSNSRIGAYLYRCKE
jgi:hypothetical protein